MVESAAQDYEKCILWPITIADYEATKGYRILPNGKPLGKDSILTTRYDRIRITGQNGAIGFGNLSPTGFEAWTDGVYDTAVKINAGFVRLKEE